MRGEQHLRQLIADLDGAARREIVSATAEGRFDELLSLAPLAKDIAGLAARWRLRQPNEPERPIEEKSTSQLV